MSRKLTSIKKDHPVRILNPFQERVEKLGGKVLGTYVNTSTPVICCCSKQHVFPILPRAVLYNNKWCAKCIKSKEEEHIYKVLQELNLKVTRDYYIPEIPNFAFPFYFETNREKVLIIYTPQEINIYGNQREEVFKNRILTAISAGYNVIRFNSTNIKYVKEYIVASLKRNDELGVY